LTIVDKIDVIVERNVALLLNALDKLNAATDGSYVALLVQTITPAITIGAKPADSVLSVMKTARAELAGGGDVEARLSSLAAAQQAEIRLALAVANGLSADDAVVKVYFC
jgi:hypothetical protein